MSSPIYGPPAHNQLPGTNLLRDAFGKTLEVRRQITQMLLDRGRRGAAPGAGMPGSRLRPPVAGKYLPVPHPAGSNCQLFKRLPLPDPQCTAVGAACSCSIARLIRF
jgi:hypothetical protein